MGNMILWDLYQTGRDGHTAIMRRCLLNGGYLPNGRCSASGRRHHAPDARKHQVPPSAKGHHAADDPK